MRLRKSFIINCCLKAVFFSIIFLLSACSKINQQPDELFMNKFSACGQIKELEQDESLILKFRALYLDSKTKIRETGYILKRQASSYTYSRIEGKDNETGIEISLNQKVDGYIHSHYENLFPIFSGSDIKSVYDAFLINKIQNLNTFIVGVVTAAGTAYLLKVKNPDEFIDYARINLEDGESYQKFQTDYNNLTIVYSSLGNVIAFETALLKMLECSGLELYKGNMNFNSWSGMMLDAYGNVVLKKCT